MWTRTDTMNGGSAGTGTVDRVSRTICGTTSGPQLSEGRLVSSKSMGQPVHSVASVFAPLIGQYAWGSRQGVGSFLTIEFGQPHLFVREALPSASTARLRKRGVQSVGQWHLWVLYCSWSVMAPHVQVCSPDWEDKARVEEALFMIDGQKLLGVRHDTESRVTNVEFEGEVELSLGPLPDAADDQWRIYEFQGRVLSFTKQGEIRCGNE